MLTLLQKHLRRLLAICLVAPLLAACDSAIYDEEGDCDIHYRLRFRFDHNLLFADAVNSQVTSVGVYAFDAETGLFAWQRLESGEALARSGYEMNLDGVEPGRYRLVAWCGLDNAHIGGKPESFTLPKLTPGVSTREELRCRLERETDPDGSHHSRGDLWNLFHGFPADDQWNEQVVEIIDPESLRADGQTVEYTVRLKKDTNRVRVILQQLSGEDIDAENFSYTIEAENGLMAHDNSLLPETKITYHPHRVGSGIAGVGLPGLLSRDETPDGIKPVKVAVADLSIGRLVKDNPVTLTVYAPDGKVSARIPLVDYALLAAEGETFYKDGRPYAMGQQEYLDREDSYTLTFFLDRSKDWQAVRLQILSWRIVFNHIDIH